MLGVRKYRASKGCYDEGNKTMGSIFERARLDRCDGVDGGNANIAPNRSRHHTYTRDLHWAVRAVGYFSDEEGQGGVCAGSARFGYIGGLAVSRAQGSDELPVRWLIRS